jgi:uncharacterized cupredoxin-like copper-binding protein
MTGIAVDRTRIGALLLVMLGAACSTGVATPSAESPPTPTATMEAASPSPPEGQIRAVLTEFDLTVSSASAPAGEVTFEVNNAGELPHEMLVIRTDLDAAELPFEDFKVVEEGLDIVAKIEDLAAGQSGTLTTELEAGHYVLICNLSGHYEESQFGPGMRANFDVY